MRSLTTGVPFTFPESSLVIIEFCEKKLERLENGLTEEGRIFETEIGSENRTGFGEERGTDDYRIIEKIIVQIEVGCDKGEQNKRVEDVWKSR